MGVRGGEAMGRVPIWIGVLIAGISLWAKDHYLTHITQPGGGFTTQIIISNPSLVSASYTLIPYDASGTSLPEVSGAMTPQTTVTYTVEALFGEGVRPTHAVIVGGAGELEFRLAYRCVAAASSAAHVEETRNTGKRFRLLCGDWRVVFDGIAVVNTGTKACDVWVDQIDENGSRVQRVKAIAQVPPMGKGSTVIGAPGIGIFQAQENAMFEITADQPLACLALRGTPPDASLGVLWQNPTTRLDLIDDAALDQFFSLAQVHTIAFSVSSAGMDQLREAPREYVPATVDIDGSGPMQVGLRLKGKAGSFISIDGEGPSWGEGFGKPGKSAFIVDFNRTVSGQDYLGLKKLTLNNLVQDPTGIHEYLGYALFRACGVPASRVGYAVVRLNGTDKGLYALIETPDNDVFLERWYGTDRGNLYEGEYGTDLNRGQVAFFDQDNGDDETKRDLMELVAALDAVSDEEAILDALETHFDFRAYLMFSVAESFLGHWDGYIWSANNYAIHHHPDDDVWTFQPWGIDQLFENPLGPFAGVMQAPGPAWPHGGRIHRMCFDSAVCRARVAEAYADLLDTIDDMDLMARAAEARALIEPLVMAEAAQYGDPQETEAAIDRVFAFLAERPIDIGRWLNCLEGGEVDHDGDGWDGCTADCDDFDDQMHPNAVERCNLLDDDCNGIIDDPAECPKIYDLTGPDGHLYRLYFRGTTWEEASNYCRAQNMEQTSIHDWQTAQFLAFELMARIQLEEGWIGLNDRDVEGDFVWSDDSPVDFLPWASGFPREDGRDSDCVVLTPWGLMDVPCASEKPCLCRQP